MERKWIEPQDRWSIYKEEHGVFWLKTEGFDWVRTYWTSWKEIENMNMDLGNVEDLTHNNVTYNPSRGRHDAFIKETQKEINRITSEIIKNMGEPRMVTNLPHFCNHTWATYVGFLKSETYCTKCKEIQK